MTFIKASEDKASRHSSMMSSCGMTANAFLIFVIVLGSALLCSRATADEWTKHPQGTVYESEGFNCRILADGRIMDLQWGQVPVASEIRLRGDARPEAGGKSCTFWQHKAHGEPLAIRKTGEAACEVRKRLVFGAEELPNAAEVELNYRLDPNSLYLEMTATLLVPLQTHSDIFQLHARLPADTFCGRGGMIRSRRAAPRRILMPFSQSADGGLKELKVRGFNEARLILPEFMLGFSATEGALSLSDEQGWGGKFSLFAREARPWFAQPVVLPAGQVCRWDLTIAVTPDR